MSCYPGLRLRFCLFLIGNSKRMRAEMFSCDESSCRFLIPFVAILNLTKIDHVSYRRDQGLDVDKKANLFTFSQKGILIES